MTLADIFNLVRLDLGEALTNNDRVSDTRLLAFGNALYLARSVQVLAFTRSDVITSVKDQAAYALDGDLCGVRGVRYHTWTTPLTETTEELLSVKEPTYRSTASATPKYWYLSGDARNIILWPAPDTAGQNITLDAYTVPYSPKPTGGVDVFTLTTDVPAWPPQFHELLAHDLTYRIASRFKFLGDEMGARAEAAKADADALALQFAEYMRRLRT